MCVSSNLRKDLHNSILRLIGQYMYISNPGTIFKLEYFNLKASRENKGVKVRADMICDYIKGNNNKTFSGRPPVGMACDVSVVDGYRVQNVVKDNNILKAEKGKTSKYEKSDLIRNHDYSFIPLIFTSNYRIGDEVKSFLKALKAKSKSSGGRVFSISGFMIKVGYLITKYNYMKYCDYVYNLSKYLNGREMRRIGVDERVIE